MIAKFSINNSKLDECFFIQIKVLFLVAKNFLFERILRKRLDSIMSRVIHGRLASYIVVRLCVFVFVWVSIMLRLFSSLAFLSKFFII